MKEGILASDARNAVSYHDMLNELIMSYDARIPYNPLRRLEEFFAWAERIIVSKNRKKIFIHFMDKKVATMPELTEVLDIPYGSIYREMRNMSNMGIVEKIVRARYIKKTAGAQPAFWGLKGKWKPDDVVLAIERHKRIKNKNYNIVKNLSQSILNDFMTPKEQAHITMKEIISLCKNNCRGFYSFDIAQQVADNLQVNHGVKVWK